MTLLLLQLLVWPVEILCCVFLRSAGWWNDLLFWNPVSAHKRLQLCPLLSCQFSLSKLVKFYCNSYERIWCYFMIRLHPPADKFVCSWVLLIMVVWLGGVQVWFAKSDNHKVRVQFVSGEHDYKQNWTTRSPVTN